jgi:hypothetical protein
MRKWTGKGKVWLAKLRGKVEDKPKEVIKEVAEAPNQEEELIRGKQTEAPQEKSDLEKWQEEQISKAESTNNPLIKECREILTTASIIEPRNFPREKQRLAIVTPVCREWNNGHIIDQLDSLAQQSADKQTYSTVLVINNSVEAS